MTEDKGDLYFIKNFARRKAKKCLRHIDDVLDRLEERKGEEFDKKDEILYSALVLACDEAAELQRMLEVVICSKYGFSCPAMADDKTEAEEDEKADTQ